MTERSRLRDILIALHRYRFFHPDATDETRRTDLEAIQALLKERRVYKGT